MTQNKSLSFGAAALVAAFFVLFSFTGAASALTATCVGAPSATNITWTASTAGGVDPVLLLWGNGATTSSQTVVVSPGTYAMTLQATDASSTVATTTCSATVNQAAPTITSFTALPTSITTGQSAVLSWVVSNASSTSINNGVGTVSGTSATVSPTATTLYTLTAVNPGGITTANAMVTVTATSTGSGSGVSAQIQALLAQIKALQAQIVQLIAGQVGSGSGGSGGTATSTPGCFNFGRDLKHGDQGDDVKELQQELAHNDPTLFPPGLISGFFGPKTEAALKMLQRRFGIDVSGTGFFGPRSRAHFAAMCGNGDNDHDGIPNAQDYDDDNDGTPDAQDAFPFNPNATSTPLMMGNHGENGKNGKNGENGKDGNHGENGRNGRDD